MIEQKINVISTKQTDNNMAISKNTRDFIDSLIDYYISEAASYRQIAEEYVPEIESVTDTAFGYIAGCVYSGFLQAYKNMQQSPSLEDIQEFNKILKDRAPLIKKAMLEDSYNAEIRGIGAKRANL
ncbi:MAG TPA: hypothetical protein VD731_02405 [Nitrosopumilaceae archaeon]|nr:hypothetical protein [Nitrosopumilaceae archaeon]